MLGIVPAAIGVLSEGAPLALVAPDALSPLAAFARSSPGLALAADGASWGSAAAGAARFHGAARRLLLEGARTNLVRNPRFEGGAAGVVGSGGAWPTNLSVSNATGLAFTLAFGTEAGLPTMDVRIQASAAANNRYILFEAANGIPLAGGATYAGSLHARLVAGSLSGFSLLTPRRRTTTATALNSALVTSMLGLGATMQRFEQVEAVAADATAGVFVLWFSAASGADATLRLAAPGFEAGSFASSPILPAAGAPAATTRAAEVLTAALASLGVADGGACTITGGIVPAAATPAGAAQTFLRLEADAANWLGLDADAGTSTVRAARRTAGTLAATNAASFTPGTGFRFAVSVGAGRVAVSVNGGAVAAATGGPAAGLATLRVGDAFFGEVAALSLRRGTASDAALPALSLAA